jgi:hypothetical protein
MFHQSRRLFFDRLFEAKKILKKGAEFFASVRADTGERVDIRAINSHTRGVSAPSTRLESPLTLRQNV